MHILLDMNLTPVWVEFFAEHGIQATHWSSIGPITESDAAIMHYAQMHGHVIMTNDLDFGTLLARTHNHEPSVILLRARILVPKTLGAMIISVVTKHQAAIESGALLVVDEYRYKLRLLPI